MTYLEQQNQLARDMGIDHLFRFGKQAAIFAQTVNIVNPRNILEIGFFAGASSLMWLSQSSANVTSVDPMKNLYSPETTHDGDKSSVQKLTDLYGPRFNFIEMDSKLVRPQLAGRKFDLMFMDGDHWPVGVRNDFNLALDLGIEWILADDFITDVREVYDKEFRNFYFLVAQFNREDQHEGKPIPMGLLRRFDSSCWRMING